jgi:hypothetical protein
MRNSDCQVEFCFSFEKCEEFGAAESRFKKVVEKIGFPFSEAGQRPKNP